MVQPRVGKGRRVIASSSDNEEDLVAIKTKSKSTPPFSKTGSKSVSATVKSRDHVDVASRPRSKQIPPPLSQTSTASLTPTPESSPNKSRKAVTKAAPKTSKPKTLYSFFNAATQRLQESSQTKVKAPATEEEEIVDVIEDGFVRPGWPTEAPSHAKNGVLAPKKRPLQTSDYQTSVMPSAALASSAHKYRKALDGQRIGIDIVEVQPSSDDDARPWAERYSPTTLEELVVHKKKVADVKQWLVAALAGQSYRTLLILKGPAGAGKTATLSVLSRDLKLDIVEWKNPTTSDFLDDDYISVSSQFDEFLHRGRQFNSLDLISPDGTLLRDEDKSRENDIESTNNKQVILVEDFPYAVLRMGMAVDAMRSTLLQCLAARPSPGRSVAPIILIITESVLSNNTNTTDNFTAHRLLGPEILHHPGTTLIEFNPVAATFIVKALNLTVQKHRRHTGVMFTPDPNTIKAIADIGDVRNAVATLEFLSLQNDISHSNGSIALSTSKSRTSKSKVKVQTPVESSLTGNSLALMSLRESTIGLFHAVGKVMYNKRTKSGSIANTSTSVTTSTPEEDEFSATERSLPTHLSHHIRPIPTDVSISTLIDETGTDTSTFLSALHENYALSCTTSPSANSGSRESTLDILNTCLDSLSDADILLGRLFSSSSSSTYSNRGGGGGNSEGQRQDEIAFQAGVRGILHALPSPVKRQTHPDHALRTGRSGGAADANRMFYPTGLKIWRKREEILGLIDFMVDQAMSGSLLDSRTQVESTPANRDNHIRVNAWSISQPGRMSHTGVETWRRRRGSPTSTTDVSTTTSTLQSSIANNTGQADTDTDLDSGPSTYFALGSGHSARHEMLLERLPYLTRILSNDSTRSSTRSSTTFLAHRSTLKQIDLITQFTGIGNLRDEDEDDGGHAISANKNAKVGGSVPWVHKRGLPGGIGPGAVGRISTGDEVADMRGLVLSDDDIEDD